MQTMALKMILERGVAFDDQKNVATIDRKSKQWELAELIDSCCVLAVGIFWVVPHILLLSVSGSRKKLLQTWKSAAVFANLQVPEPYEISMDGQSGKGGGYVWTGEDMSRQQKAKGH